MIFGVPGSRKSMKNRSKIGSKVDEKKVPQNHRFWKRFWVDFRATLGPKIDHKSIQEGIELAMQKKESHPGPDEMVVLMWRAVILGQSGFLSQWVIFFVEVGAVNSRRSAAMAADLLEFGRETEQN